MRPQIQVCVQIKTGDSLDDVILVNNIYLFFKFRSFFLVHQAAGGGKGGGGHGPSPEALEQAAHRAISTNIRCRHMSQSVDPFVVRAGPGIGSDSEGLILDARLLVRPVVFGLISSPSPATPYLCYTLLGSRLIVRAPKGRDGRDSIVRSRGRAETTSESGQ
jgi:hypothetical protein